MTFATDLRAPEWITSGATITGGLDLLGLSLHLQTTVINAYASWRGLIASDSLNSCPKNASGCVWQQNSRGFRLGPFRGFIKRN